MIIYEDTRQKRGKHSLLHKYFKQNNIQVIRKVLDVGDYMFPDGKIAIDTKQNTTELAADLYRDYKELNAKYSKCYKEGIKLIVLVETELKYLSELMTWTDIHTDISGKYLLNLMHRLKVSYDIDFYFCDKKNTGQAIISLLNGENSTVELQNIIFRVF